MRTLKLTLAYDGTDFAGWQSQPAQRTIQGVIEATLQTVTGEPHRIAASGRTDAGVHALGQVVSFDTNSHLPAERLLRALNSGLPEDVAVIESVDVRPGFHAIRDAIRKRYRYVVDDGPTADIFRRRYAWHYRQRLDALAMQRAARPLVGTHDFRSFETGWPNRETSVRTVLDLRVERQPADSNLIHVEIEADGFLYNMVRAIVGTLVEVGRGARGESWPADALAAMDRRAAGPTAPARGLFLLRVDYDLDSTRLYTDATAVSRVTSE